MTGVTGSTASLWVGGKRFHLCIVSTFTSEGVVESDVTEVPEARFSSRKQPGSFQWGVGGIADVQVCFSCNA